MRDLGKDILKILYILNFVFPLSVVWLEVSWWQNKEQTETQIVTLVQCGAETAVGWRM